MPTRSQSNNSERASKATRQPHVKSAKPSKVKPRSDSKSSAKTEAPSKSTSPKVSQESASSTASRIQVRQPQPKSPLQLYPFQKRWIEDKSRLKIAVKSRRIGYSFADGLGHVLDCIEHPRKNHIILSRGERQAKEFITEAAAPHVRAIGVIASITDSHIPHTSIKVHEISLSNGSRIIALPASPDTARSFEGDVTLDEFAFHKNARKIYEAIEPSITRGYKLGIISTTNGQQGAYFDLSKNVGLVDGRRNTDVWSAHKTDLLE